MIVKVKDGIAYQEDRTKSVKYDTKYYNKLEKYKENEEMFHAINEFRMELVQDKIHMYDVLDIGCGNCSFIEYYNDYTYETKSIAYGYDIMPKSVEKLDILGRFITPYDKIPGSISGFTFWDSLEHIPEPQKLLERLPYNTYTFISMPIFSNVKNLEISKHYRPNEHYWYFTEKGLKKWMAKQDFNCLDVLPDEAKLGREDIKTFVFKKEK